MNHLASHRKRSIHGGWVPIGPLNAHDFRLCEDGATLREESDALVSLLAPMCAEAARAASKPKAKPRIRQPWRFVVPAEVPVEPAPFAYKPLEPLSPWEQFKQECWEEDVAAWLRECAR